MSALGAPDVAAAEAVAVLMTEVSEGRLTAVMMANRAATRCREVFGQCDGPTDPLWQEHLEICRAVLGHGGLPAAELAQWTAVARSRENPGAAVDYPPVARTATGEEHGPGNGGAEPNDETDDEFADVPRDVLAEADAAAMEIIGRYRRRQPKGVK